MQALRRGLSAVFLVVLAACGAGAGAAPSAAMPAGAPSELVGQAVGFTLVSAAGEPTGVPTAGVVTLVDYWSPTCEPCRTKLPALWAERARLEAAGVSVLLVGVLDGGQTTELATATLREWGAADAPFLIDRENVAAREAGITEMPGAQVFDRAGVLRWQAPLSASAADIVQAALAVK